MQHRTPCLSIITAAILLATGFFAVVLMAPLFTLIWVLLVILVIVLWKRATSTGHKKILACLAVLLLAMLTYAVALWSVTIPSESVTWTREKGLAIGLTSYFQSNGSLPATLDDFARSRGLEGRWTDGWGRPILYRVEDKSTFVIESLGRDGTRGGVGHDADIILRVDAAQPDAIRDITQLTRASEKEK